MKAYPGELEKKTAETQNKPENDHRHKPDSVFAMIRRLQGELKSLETDIANLKRDVRRHDRQIYDQAKRPGEPSAQPELFSELKKIIGGIL